MAKSAAKESDRRWMPSRFALWSQRWGDPQDDNPIYPTVSLLRHPTAPFTAVVKEINDLEMQRVAYRYLEQANKLAIIDPPLGLPPEWLRELDPDAKPDKSIAPSFGWLPIKWPHARTENVTPGSLVSFQVERDGGKLPDRTVILLAAPRAGTQCLGSAFGIRVVAHAREASKTKFEIRITGMSASLPFGIYRSSGWMNDFSSDEQANSFLGSLLTAEVKNSMAELLGLENESIVIRGVRLGRLDDGDVQIEWQGTGKTAGGPIASTPYSFVFTGTRNTGVRALVSKVELVADASPPTPGAARVFPLDPASLASANNMRGRRPSRSDKELEKYRKLDKITDGQRAPLTSPLGATGAHVHEAVVVCPGFVLHDYGATPRTPEQVDLPGTNPDLPAIRSNDFAAISAFKNFQQLFERFEAYGLSATDYFRITRLPLEVFYRSGIRPGAGKNGEAINARVLVEGWHVEFEGPTPPGQRPGVEVHLALGDRSRRNRKPWNGKDRSPAEPLGIAADARWIWHEIGHVLLMSSVGELQFRFCHSPGDALAAIVGDPQSELTDPNWRGATFPWVFTPRRHDRCVTHGWSWGGSMHHALAQVPATQAPRRKGYLSEQIMSSSMFRLYRCLGGDTKLVPSGAPDRWARESASHYSVYLIMRALQILGSSGVVPAYEADQFISALIDADVGTGRWDVTFPPRSSAPFQFHRVGGCAHKVIRWAFEAQGMYTMAGRITNAPGFPPPVDVYIENHRPAVNDAHGEVQYGPGSYFPVSLDWDRGLDRSYAPAWQATEDAVHVDGNDIFVTVGNRGTQTAADVEVRVWLCEWPAGEEPPQWNNGRWQQCRPPTTGRQDIPARGSTTFGPFPRTPISNRYVVLAEATCGDDYANIDPATLLPCSTLTDTPLVDLVANDNNLGLRVIGEL